MTSIDRALAEATAFAADRRTHRCELGIHAVDGGAVALSGTVLDPGTLDQVLKALAQTLAGAPVDASAVRVLARAAPQRLAVSVGVADLHLTAAHAAPVQTQLLLGDSVERFDERDGWSFVRLDDGYLGWVASTYLARGGSSPATHRIVTPVAELRAATDPRSSIVGRLAIGTRVRVREPISDFGRIELPDGRDVHVASAALRPIGATLALQARASAIVDAALSLIGVPYLWGGVTAFGIDCSGLMRVCHALAGIEIPRDADWQRDASRPVEPPLQAGDLLFFAETGAHRSVSHVGLSLGDGRVVHASRTHAGVAIDALDQATWLADAFVGAGAFCR
jgi:cell wall-associated NlpC family hydrolase